MKKNFMSLSYNLNINHRKSDINISLGTVSSLFLSSCSSEGAPVFMIMDSYFPMWMMCAGIGIVIAIIARIVFIRMGLDMILSFRFCIYTCIAIIVSCSFYLLFTTR